jgi:hypothetical protein
MVKQNGYILWQNKTACVAYWTSLKVNTMTLSIRSLFQNDNHISSIQSWRDIFVIYIPFSQCWPCHPSVQEQTYEPLLLWHVPLFWHSPSFSHSFRSLKTKCTPIEYKSHFQFINALGSLRRTRSKTWYSISLLN